MLIKLPTPPLCVLIPDEWLWEAGVQGFKPASRSYRLPSAPFLMAGEEEVPLQEIAPMLRKPGIHPDTHGFRRRGNHTGDGPGGMVDVLQAIAERTYLPPVQIRLAKEVSPEGFRFVVLDGFHRLYASYALGFTHLPCIQATNVLSDGSNPKLRFGDPL
jgi:hypothetical protein